jgi:hypothetical protein
MKFGYNSKQIFAGLTFGFLVMTGTYNAIVINSESTISGVDIKFAKRLDEVYGSITSKREVAAAMNWQKLSIKQAAVVRAKSIPQAMQETKSESSASGPVSTSTAAVKEDLSLNLTAVINPKKWQQGLTNTQFSGSLSTNEGVIESLSVSLPNGEGLSVSFSEMAGNVFEYDFEGELYSGMMYQDGQNSYVVSLTNGPLEGTRLTFTSEASLEDQMQVEETQRIAQESNEAAAGVQTDEVATAQPAPEQTPELTAQNAVNFDQQIQQQAMQEVDGGVNNPYGQDQQMNEGDPQMAPEQAGLYNPDQTQAAM